MTAYVVDALVRREGALGVGTRVLWNVEAERALTAGEIAQADFRRRGFDMLRWEVRCVEPPAQSSDVRVFDGKNWVLAVEDAE